MHKKLTTPTPLPLSHVGPHTIFDKFNLLIIVNDVSPPRLDTHDAPWAGGRLQQLEENFLRLAGRKISSIFCHDTILRSERWRRRGLPLCQQVSPRRAPISVSTGENSQQTLQITKQRDSEIINKSGRSQNKFKYIYLQRQLWIQFWLKQLIILERPLDEKFETLITDEIFGQVLQCAGIRSESGGVDPRWQGGVCQRQQGEGCSSRQRIHSNTGWEQSYPFTTD